jgi:hypothetical protein
MPRDNHYVYQLMLRTWLDPKIVRSLIYSLSLTQRAVANEGKQAGVWNSGKDFVLLLTSRCAQTHPPFLLCLLCYPRPYLDEHVEQQCLACIAARRVIGLHAIVSQVGLGICESTGKKRRERESQIMARVYPDDGLFRRTRKGNVRKRWCCCERTSVSLIRNQKYRLGTSRTVHFSWPLQLLLLIHFTRPGIPNFRP